MGQAVAADEKNYQTALAGREDCIVQPFLEGAVFCVDVARDSAGQVRAAARQELLRNKSGLGMTVEVLPAIRWRPSAPPLRRPWGWWAWSTWSSSVTGTNSSFWRSTPAFPAAWASPWPPGMDFAEMMLLCHSGGSVEAFPAAPKHALLARESQIILTKQL